MNQISDYHKRCYVLGRYSELYRQAGTFNQEAEALIVEGMQLGETEYLQHMISRDEIYDEADKKWAPILIFVGDMTCYGVLDHFARTLAEKLDQAGELVELYDTESEGLEGLVDYFGKRFRGIIGMHSYAFSVRMQDGSNLLDHILGPKFNMILDHPLWMKEHLTKGPDNYYVLTEDKNYKECIEKYYPMVKKAIWLPPGGETWGGLLSQAEDSMGDFEKNRSLELTFMGSINDWKKWLPQYNLNNQRTGGFAAAFKAMAEAHLDWSWERSFELVLEQEIESGRIRRLNDSEIEFLEPIEESGTFPKTKWEVIELFFEVKSVCFIVMSEMREKIIRCLLDAGIQIHVFGDKWQEGDFFEHENLICHPEVSPMDVPEVFSKSLMSLNIMAWHKAGMTERLANIMMNGALCISDESTYLRENYEDGEDMILFSLDSYEELPGRIKALLQNPEEIRRIAENGYKKAVEMESWDRRAGQILEILNEAAREVL